MRWVLYFNLVIDRFKYHLLFIAKILFKKKQQDKLTLAISIEFIMSNFIAFCGFYGSSWR